MTAGVLLTDVIGDGGKLLAEGGVCFTHRKKYAQCPLRIVRMFSNRRLFNQL